MFYVDDEVLNAYNANSRQINVRLSIQNLYSLDNNDIISLSITESINDSTSLSLGNISSRKLTFKCLPEKLKYQDTIHYIDVRFGIDSLPADKKYLNLGRFYIKEMSSSDNYKTLTVTAYDVIQRIIETAGETYHRLRPNILSNPENAEETINDIVSTSAYNYQVNVDADTIERIALRTAEPCDYNSDGSVSETAGSYGVGKENLVFIPAYIDSIMLRIHCKSKYTSPLKVCFYNDFYGNDKASFDGYKEYTGYSFESEDDGYILVQEISKPGIVENLNPLYMGFSISGNDTQGENDAYDIFLTFPEHTPLIDMLKLNPSDDVNTSPATALRYMTGCLAANLSMDYTPKDSFAGSIGAVNPTPRLKALPFQETGFEITPDITYQGGFRINAKEPFPIEYVSTGSKENVVTSGEGDFGINFENPYINDETITAFILARYGHLRLMPGTIKYRGNPFIRAGDIIIIKNTDGKKYNFLVCKNELRFSGGLSCTLTCNLSTDRSASYVSTPNTVSLSQRVASFNSDINNMGLMKTLWSGKSRMGAEESITLSEAISNQLRGIILEWKLASSETADPYGDSSFQFIPKGKTGTCVHDSHTVDYGVNCAKRISVDSDNKISGSQYNTQSGTSGGMTYANDRLVLINIYSW